MCPGVSEGASAIATATLQRNLPIKEYAQNTRVHAPAPPPYTRARALTPKYTRITHLWKRTPTRSAGTHVRRNMRETGGRCSARHWPPHQHGRTPFPHQHHRAAPTLPRPTEVSARLKGGLHQHSRPYTILVIIYYFIVERDARAHPLITRSPNLLRLFISKKKKI